MPDRGLGEAPQRVRRETKCEQHQHRAPERLSCNRLQRSGAVGRLGAGATGRARDLQHEDAEGGIQDRARRQSHAGQASHPVTLRRVRHRMVTAREL